MDLISMREQVRNIFGDLTGAQITDSEINAWLNEALLKISGQSEFIGDHAETNVVANQRAYNLAPDTIKIERVELDEVKLSKTTLQELDTFSDTHSTVTGSPKWYYIWGEKLYLYPTPTESGTGNLDIWYKRYPAVLVSDEQIPEIPDHLHYTMVRFALMRAKEKDEEFQDAAQIESGVQQELGEHAHEESTREEETYPGVTPTADDAGWEY